MPQIESCARLPAAIREHLKHTSTKKKRGSSRHPALELKIRN
jgi:hypothetical protein